MSFSNDSCDVCGARDTRLLFDRGRDGPLLAVICQQCGFVFLSPRPTLHAVSTLYETPQFSVAARGAALPSTQKVNHSNGQAITRFLRLREHLALDALPAGRVLDIGCGLGSFLFLMQGLGWQPVGIEPDPNYSAAGTEMYQVPIHATLYEHEDYRHTPFNLIASFHVLEHVVSPRHFLDKAFAELAPEGWLYLELPCIEQPHKGNFEHFFWSVHPSSFSHATLAGLLQSLGFVVEHRGYANGTNALWVLARKPRTPQPQPLVLPLDDPQQVYQRVHRDYATYKLRSSSVVGRTVIQSRALLQRAATRLAHEPRAALPFAQRTLHGYRQKLARKLAPQLPQVRYTPIPTITMRPRLPIHVGLHRPSNAGDTLLFTAVRQVFDHTHPLRWNLHEVRTPVTAQQVAHWNARATAVLVGGGGLFLRDTNPNNISGWQWPCATEHLHALRVPLIMYAVGYNRFRGQEEFAPVFWESLNALVERAAFIGLRNSGSMRRVCDYLPPELHERIQYQPCPTTVLAYLYPTLLDEAERNPRRLAFNAAFDRHHLRLAGQHDAVLDRLARVMRHAQDAGWEIDLAVHVSVDRMIIPWLMRHRVRFNEVNLTSASAIHVAHYYSRVGLAIGMRGHSQMIPFGTHTPIISLITHDKLAWFLQDVGHPEWGIELETPDYDTVLWETLTTLGADLTHAQAQIRAAQARLWAVTQANRHQILPYLEGTATYAHTD